MSNTVLPILIYNYFSETDKLLWEKWMVMNAKQEIGACFAFFLLAMIFEGLKGAQKLKSFMKFLSSRTASLL